MALPQQKFREIVFQLLYSSDFVNSDKELMVDLIMNELEISKKNVRLAQDKVDQVREKLPEIDALIASASQSFEFDRIQSVIKNILRLGVFELRFDPEIPHQVAIAEAMRLARKFSNPESASFINAILDEIKPKE